MPFHYSDDMTMHPFETQDDAIKAILRASRETDYEEARKLVVALRALGLIGWSAADSEPED